MNFIKDINTLLIKILLIAFAMICLSYFIGCIISRPEYQDHQVQETYHHSELDVKFYKIPVNKQEEFHRLFKLRMADKNRINGNMYSNETHIAFWRFIRETVGIDLEIYRKDGYNYTWSYQIINSNNILIHNLKNFKFDDDNIRTLYGIYGSEN